MAYTIPYTDQANKGTITIQDSTLNQDTSLKLPGRNTTAYGSAIAENFLHLLENFASATQKLFKIQRNGLTEWEFTSNILSGSSQATASFHQVPANTAR